MGGKTHSPADHRPWLIISRNEAQALHRFTMRALARRPAQGRDPVLQRALRVIERQLSWIDGDDGEMPSINAALARENGGAQWD